jgi:alkyl hydroperoxide reductase subunit AhpF
MTSQGRVLIEGNFQETSVQGVFAASSCATVVDDDITNISSGMVAGMGANLQIAEDDAGL